MRQFPHCDPRILHAPGECQFCDESGLQEIRKTWGINFTNHDDGDRLPCPADVYRDPKLRDRWHGNRAATKEDLARADAEMEALMKKFDPRTG